MKTATNDSLKIVGDTPEWLVLNKPAGWLTIPGRTSGAQAALHPVLHTEAQSAAGQKLWVVHRLDIETSGVILFAKTSEAHRKANDWFAKRETRKFYDCLAAGRPSLPIIKIDDPIAGVSALSQVEVKASFNEGFLGRVRIVTGRRHQIRIHLASRGHPLWGDLQYGGSREIALGGRSLTVSRVALHASRLELPSGEKFEAPWPTDFSEWVDRLKQGGSRG